MQELKQLSRNMNVRLETLDIELGYSLSARKASQNDFVKELLNLCLRLQTLRWNSRLQNKAAELETTALKPLENLRSLSLREPHLTPDSGST